MTMIRQLIATIPSRNRDGSLRYPGFYLQTWVRVASVWMLVGSEPYRPKGPTP